MAAKKLHRKGRHPAPMVQRPGDDVAIAVGDAVEPRVEARQHLADASLLGVVVARSPQ